jgi:hypothetical protein
MIGIEMKRFGMRMWVCLLVAFAIGGAALAQTPSPNEKKTISITWLGHAAFEIVSSGGTHLLIDPFLTKNPATPAENKDLTRIEQLTVQAKIDKTLLDDILRRYNLKLPTK